MQKKNFLFFIFYFYLRYLWACECWPPLIAWRPGLDTQECSSLTTVFFIFLIFFLLNFLKSSLALFKEITVWSCQNTGFFIYFLYEYAQMLRSRSSGASRSQFYLLTPGLQQWTSPGKFNFWWTFLCVKLGLYEHKTDHKNQQWDQLLNSIYDHSVPPIKPGLRRNNRNVLIF